jgi:hypothetical protein
MEELVSTVGRATTAGMGGSDCQSRGSFPSPGLSCLGSWATGLQRPGASLVSGLRVLKDSQDA